MNKTIFIGMFILLIIFVLIIITIIIGVLAYLLCTNKKTPKISREQNRHQNKFLPKIIFSQLIGDKGHTGEYKTARALLKIVPDAKILTNAYIPNGDNYAELDIIMISIHGIYVIENKNYSGWIYGDEKDQYWTQTFGNGKKFRFYNPVKQNETHVKSLKELLEKNNFSCTNIRSIICFNDDATLKNVHSMTPVSKTSWLSWFIDIHERTYSVEDVERIYELLFPYTQNNKEIATKHVERVQKNKLNM